MTNFKKINKSLIGLLRSLDDSYKSLSDKGIMEDVHRNSMKKGNSREPYTSYGKIKCSKGHLTAPFFFGDRSLYRDVMMECDTCGEIIGFTPIEVIHLSANRFVASNIYIRDLKRIRRV